MAKLVNNIFRLCDPGGLLGETPEARLFTFPLGLSGEKLYNFSHSQAVGEGWVLSVQLHQPLHLPLWGWRLVSPSELLEQKYHKPGGL